MGIIELVILIGFYQDYRRNKKHCITLLRFIFIIFPITFLITLLLFYPLHNYTSFWYLIMFPFYIPFLFLYKTILHYFNKNGRVKKNITSTK